MIKTLQGKNTMYAAIREWCVPTYNFDFKSSLTEQCARSIFKSSSEASTLLQQMINANAHLVNQVFICANKQGEFGDACATK